MHWVVGPKSFVSSLVYVAYGQSLPKFVSFAYEFVTCICYVCRFCFVQDV